MLFFIVICAAIGFWLGDTSGMLIGGAVGYLLSRVLRLTVRKGVRIAQAQFVESTFAVMGALCKADGVVTREEIQVTQQLFDRLQLSPEQKEVARSAFNRGKAPDFDLDAEVDQFARGARSFGVLSQLFLQVQLAAVAADGEVHPAEHAMLVRIARRLGLNEHDVAQLEALLRAAAVGAPTAGAPPTKQRLADAYTALGVTPESSVSEIKRAYRKLISENHPDKLAAKGMPEAMRQIAEERVREMNAAYGLIKQARQFS